MSVKRSSTIKKIRKKRTLKVKEQEATPQSDQKPVVSQQAPNYPSNQQPIPMPPVDKATVEGVEKLMEVSYLGYLRELRKADIKDDCVSVDRLSSMLSEFVGPYLLIGYLPDNEPIEIMWAPNPKDREAVLERLRKTFIRHMNAAAI